MRQKLTDTEVASALERLSGWDREGEAISKTFRFAKFSDGIAFVDRVAIAADAMDHHPDIDIRYIRVRIVLSTHDAGGITASDVKLAGEIERVS